MKASDAMIVWNWNIGPYCGPEPQIDVIRGRSSRKKWKRYAELDPTTTPDQLLLSLMVLFHDMTVLYGIPGRKVLHAFLKIDEYKAMFEEKRERYYLIGTFKARSIIKETTCQTL